MVESGKTYAGQDWQKLEALTVYDRDASGNLLMNPSFEQGSDNACWITYPGFAGTPEKWEKGAPVIDGGVAKFGKHRQVFAAHTEISCPFLFPFT